MLLKKSTDNIIRCNGTSDELIVSGLSVSLFCGTKKKEIVLLNDASFSASPCQVVGILGLSSSGKTSILNALGGLYVSGDYSLSGKIQYPSKFLNPFSRHCFIWVDEFYESNITVEEYLKSILALSLIPLKVKESLLYMDLLMDAFKLKPIRHCIISSSRNKPLLSLYDRKRISLCRAFIQRPNMLLIDEITSGLSDEESDAIWSLIKDYNACGTHFSNHQQITILTLHQPSRKLFFSLDKVVIMDNGNVMYQGTPFDLMDYLETNYSLSHHTCTHLTHPGNLALYIFQLNRYDTVNSRKVFPSLCSSLHTIEEVYTLKSFDNVSNTSRVDNCYRNQNPLENRVHFMTENNFKLHASGMVPFNTQVNTLLHRRFLQYKRYFYLWLLITLVHLIHSFFLGLSFNENVAELIQYTNKSNAVPVQQISACLVKLNEILETLENSPLFSSQDWCTFSEELAPGFITVNRMYDHLNFTTIVKALEPLEEMLCIENPLKLNQTQDNFSLKHFINIVLHGVPILNEWQEQTRCKDLAEAVESSSLLDDVLSIGSNIIKSVASMATNLNIAFTSWDNLLLSDKLTASNFQTLPRQLSDDMGSSPRFGANTSEKVTCNLQSIQTEAIDTLKHIKPIMHHLNNTMKKVFLDEILKSFIGNEAISHLIDMVDVFFKLISSFIDSLEPNVVLETYQAKTSTETNVPEWILSFEMFLLNIYKRNVVFIQLSNAFLFHVIFVSFISYSNLLTFVRERSLFNREIKQNLYSTSAYFLSRSMIDIPLQTIPVVLMSLSFYVILGLHKLLDSQRSLLVLLVHSFLFIFICIVISIASYAFVSMVASISPSLAVAMCLLSMFLVTWLTTIGFLLRQIVFPTWIVPVQWISFYRWGFFALIKGTFLSFQTQHTILYRLILTLSGIPNLSLFFFFVFLVICITSYYAIAFLCLCFFHQNIGLLL